MMTGNRDRRWRRCRLLLHEQQWLIERASFVSRSRLWGGSNRQCCRSTADWLAGSSHCWTVCLGKCLFGKADASQFFLLPSHAQKHQLDDGKMPCKWHGKGVNCVGSDCVFNPQGPAPHDEDGGDVTWPPGEPCFKTGHGADLAAPCVIWGAPTDDVSSVNRTTSTPPNHMKSVAQWRTRNNEPMPLWSTFLLLATSAAPGNAFTHRSALAPPGAAMTAMATTTNRPMSQQLASNVEDSPIATIDEEDIDEDEDDVLVDSITEKLGDVEGLWYSDDFYGSHGRECFHKAGGRQSYRRSQRTRRLCYVSNTNLAGSWREGCGRDSGSC